MAWFRSLLRFLWPPKPEPQPPPAAEPPPEPDWFPDLSSVAGQIAAMRDPGGKPKVIHIQMDDDGKPTGYVRDDGFAHVLMWQPIDTAPYDKEVFISDGTETRRGIKRKSGWGGRREASWIELAEMGYRSPSQKPLKPTQWSPGYIDEPNLDPTL